MQCTVGERSKLPQSTTIGWPAVVARGPIGPRRNSALPLTDSLHLQILRMHARVGETGTSQASWMGCCSGPWRVGKLSR